MSGSSAAVLDNNDPIQELIARLNHYPSEGYNVSPEEFYTQYMRDVSHHCIKPVATLKEYLSPLKTVIHLGQTAVMGIIISKFHPTSFKHQKRPGNGCFFRICIKSNSDYIRVALWNQTAMTFYNRIHVGMIIYIKGLKLKTMYQPDIAHAYPVVYSTESMQPVEIHIDSLDTLGTTVRAIDLYTIWNYKPAGSTSETENIYPMRVALSPYIDSGILIPSLEELSNVPVARSHRITITGYCIYKSNEIKVAVHPKESSTHSAPQKKQLPYIWLAIYDGSLDGTKACIGNRSYVWLRLRDTFQIDILQKISAGELLVITGVQAVVLLHQDDLPRNSSWRMFLHSTGQSQAYIVSELQATSGWNYLPQVERQKDATISNTVSAIKRNFSDTPPLVHISDDKTIYEMGCYTAEF